MVVEKNTVPKPKRNKGGRPKGSPNKRSPALTRAVKFMIRKSLKQIPDGDLFEGDAYELFCVIYRDLRQDGTVRMEAAGKAIRHERPQLMSSTVQHTGTLTLESLVTEAIKNPPTE
jgi:hypothetical protein